MTMLWKPLLSATVPIDPATEDFDWACVPFPVYASPKLDGYRSMVQGGVLVSRNGLAVRNKELQARYGRVEHNGLDVELCDGPPTDPGVFNKTSSTVRKADADAKAVTAWAIDFMSGYEDTFKERLNILKESYGGTIGWEVGVRVIKQTLIRDVEALKAY